MIFFFLAHGKGEPGWVESPFCNRWWANL